MATGGTRKSKKPPKKKFKDTTALDSGGEKFTFFFRSESPFSQWHPSEFKVDGVHFNCCEQFMMYQKASTLK